MIVRHCFAWIVGIALWCGRGAVAWADRPSPDPAAGQAAYVQHCARCHGTAGRGDGLDAKRFYPRPRDLTLGIYKFRSTVSGTPPTDEDVFQTITHGLPGTNMPDWQHLDEAVRWQLVEYLKSLSPVFAQTQPSPIELPRNLEPKRTDVARGRALYEQLGCAACHGPHGRANGPSAAGLVDDWGMPIRPANLTQGWAYRGGPTPRAILTRLLAGIDGTGMPSYVDAISSLPNTSAQDAWHLAAYVASLQEPARWNMIAHALVATEALPLEPADPRWQAAEPTDVRLRNVVTPEGEWAAPPTVRAVSFRAIANDERIVFQVSWDDPTQDPTDGLALLLQPPGTQGDVVTLQAWPYEGAPMLDLCYWGADGAAAFEARARDYESVRARNIEQAILKSRATYTDGRWTLVLQRALQPIQPAGAARISDDTFTSMAFAVWDGGNPSARAVSPWVDVVLSRRRMQP